MDKSIFAIRDTIRRYAMTPLPLSDIIIGYAIPAGSLLMLMIDVYPSRLDELSDEYSYTSRYALGISFTIALDVWRWHDAHMELCHGIHDYSIKLEDCDDPLKELLKQDIINLGYGNSPRLAKHIPSMNDHIKSLVAKCLKYLLGHSSINNAISAAVDISSDSVTVEDIVFS